MSRKRSNNKLNKKKTGIIAVLALVCLVGIYTFNFSTRSEVIAKQGITFKEFDSDLLIRDEIEINEDDGGVYIIFPEKINGYYVQQYFVDDESVAPVEEDNTNTINENIVNEVVDSNDTNTISNTTESTNTLVENTVANIINENTNTVLENTISNTTNTNTVTNTTSPKTDNTIIDTLTPSNTTVNNAVAGETKTHETSLEINENAEEVKTEENNEVNTTTESEETVVEDNSSTNTTVNEETTNTVSNDQTNTTAENTVKPEETITPGPTQEVKEEKEEEKQENPTEETEPEELPTKEISNIIPFDETNKENDADIEIPGKDSHKPGDKLYIDQEKINNEEFSIEVKLKMVEINGRRLYSQDLLYESALVRVLVSGYIPADFNLDVQAESIEKVEELKADVAELANSTVLGAYNIKIVKDNEEYQPVNYFQAVNVSITSPEQFLDNLLNNPIKIIHIKEDEEKNEIVFEKILLANKTEDTVECRTNEFSTYAVLQDDTFTENEITVYNFDTEYDYYVGRDITDNDGTAQGKYTDETLANVDVKYYSYDTSLNLEANYQLTESDMTTFNGVATPDGNPVTTLDTAYSRYLRSYTATISIRRNPVNNNNLINNNATWTLAFRVPKEIDVNRFITDNASFGVTNATYQPLAGSDTEGTLTVTGSRFLWTRSGGNNNSTYTANFKVTLDLKKDALSTTYNNVTMTGISNLNLQVTDGGNVYNISNSNINGNLGNATDDFAKDIQVYTRYEQQYLLDFVVESQTDHYIDANSNWNMSFSLPNNFISTGFNADNSNLSLSSADFSSGGEGEEGTLSLAGSVFGNAWQKQTVSKYATQIKAKFDMLGDNECLEVATFTPMSNPTLGNKKITTVDRILIGYISGDTPAGQDKGGRQNCVTYTTCVPIENGQAKIELIDNPFMDRPYDFGFNGWKIKSITKTVSGSNTTISGGSISTDTNTYEQTLNASINHTAGAKYTVVLEADWQPASVVFLGGTGASDNNNGLTSSTPVLTMERAYSIMASNKKTATNASNREVNIMVLNGGDYDQPLPQSATIINPLNTTYLWTFEQVGANTDRYRLKSVANGRYLQYTGNNTRTTTNNVNDATVFTLTRVGNNYQFRGYQGSINNRYMTTGGSSSQANNYLTLIESNSLVTGAVVNTTSQFAIASTNGNTAIITNGNNITTGSINKSTVSTPYTITSLYNGVDNRTSASYIAGTTTLPFDMQFDFVKFCFSGGYTGTGTTAGRITQANGHNLRIGRGILLPDDHTATAEAIMCGPNGINKVVIESGKYRVLNSGRTANSTGDITINNIMVLGNDIDRLRKDNDSMKVYMRVASRTGSGDAEPADDSLPLFKIIVKSGTYGIECFNDTRNGTGDAEYAYAGIYVGGLTYANDDYGDRELYVEGGVIANIIGGLGVAKGNPVTTRIYVKDGNIINIVGGAGRSTTYGDRIIQVTGGTVQFSVNGGSNGYMSTNADGNNGQLDGNTLVYIGGNANIGTTDTQNETLYGVTAGSVFGAGNGNANASASSGRVNSSHIIIDGNAKILNSVYGGGNYGTVQGGGSHTVHNDGDQIIATSTTKMNDLTAAEGVMLGNDSHRSYLNAQNGFANQNLTQTVPGNTALWIFEPVGNGRYRIKNKNGRYLSQNYNNLSTTTNATNAQSFTVTENNGALRIYYTTGNIWTTNHYLTLNGSNNFTLTDNANSLNAYTWKEYDASSTDTQNAIAQIDILGGTISQNVYGGANRNSIHGNTLINMVGGSTVGAYQGATGTTTYVGEVKGTIYGGSNVTGTIEGDAYINLSGGTVGTAATGNNETDAVFGGGKGNETYVSGDTYVTIKDNDKGYDLKINGSIYGGSEEGAITGGSTIEIKDNTSTTNSKVSLEGNVYGGGKGTTARAATTGGNVLVTVDGGDYDNDKTKIFGGCNVRGTIDGGITVNIGETADTTAYQVYGGGNQADVTNITSSVYVNIYENSTVDSAYNGGNSAGIQGNQGLTPRKITVDGGTVGDVYGGSNASGNLTETHVEVKNSATVNNVYGGGYGDSTNINGPTNITITDSTVKKTTDDGTTGNVYGGGYGGKVATNNGNTNITITNTTIENNVYGGGLGANASVARNTTVNISDDSSYHNVYGGGNKGTVSGNTTVNVDGTEGDNIYGGGCAAAVNGKTNVTVDNSTISNSIFGGGEGNTAYVGTNGSPQSTTVVVNQTSGTTTAKYVYGGGDAGEVRGTTSVTVTGATITEDVFGGGNEANVTSNTTVLVEDSATAKNVYGGGNAGDVGGKTTVNVNSSSTISENVYGGGNQGHVTGDVFVTVENATVTENVYGGGNQGNVGGKTEVIVDTSTVSQSVYGGGNQGTVGSTTKVEIDDSTISNSVYGGGNQGNVNGAADVSVDNSTITNDIFGGGQAANVTGTTVEVLNGTTARYVYGGGDQGRVTTSGTNVTVADSTISQNIYGGGNGAPTGTGPGSVTGNVTLLVEDTDVSGSVFGAGRGVSATTTGNTDVDVISSTIGIDVYGGGDNGVVIGSTDVNLDDADITGSAYAAGNGENALVTIGTHIVAQNGTTIGASLFGGGNAAPTGPESDTVNEDVYAIVDVSGAIIGENVYGGANSSVIYGNTVVNIGTGAITEYYGTNKNYTQTQIDIGGTIYGGGEQMDPTKEFNYDTISVEGNIDINIDGAGYDTDGIYIHGSIFGSGNASRAGIPIGGSGENKVYEENNGAVTIRNYGTTDNPKELTSIQRTGETKIDNSALSIYGATDSTSLHPEAYFTLNRIKELTLKNGSTIYLRNGSNILEKFSSMYGPDDNEVPAQVTVEDGEVKNSNVINRLYMYSGINLNVSPSETLETYGEVTGMTYFGIYKIDENTNAIIKGIYDEGYNSTSIQWNDRDYVNCYVSGLHYQPPTYEEHNIKVDGFYTTYEVFTIDGNPSFTPPDDVVLTESNYSDYNTYPYIEYITPTPEQELYYMWYAGPNDNVFLFPLTLFASKFSTFSAKELNLLGISFKNATMRIDRVEADLRDEDCGLYPRNEIPNVNMDPDEANNKFGLAMRTGNSGWSMNGSTEFYAEGNDASYNGDVEYKIENSTVTPTLSFYLYHSNNITEEKTIGDYRIVMNLSYWKDDLNKGRAIVIIDVTMATILYDDFGYNGAITPGRQYDLFASTETNITSKSSFSTYFELAEPNFTQKEDIANYYEDSYRVITTQYAFPPNTTITMIDRSDNNNPKYYYYIVTQADYNAGKIAYRLDEFREMGSTDKYYNEKLERENYLIESLDYEYESFIFTADFESAEFDQSLIGSDHVICTGQEFWMYLNAEVDGHTETLFGLMDDQKDDMKYSIYDSESLIDIDANLSKNKVYHGNTTTLNVNTNYSITVVGGKRVYDTRYFDQKLGAKLTFFKEDDEGHMIQVSGSELLGTYFTINGESYYPRADGTTRIKLAEKVSNASSPIVIHTENSSLSGEYLIHIDSFGSADGVYYGINASDSAEVTLTIIDNIFGLDSHLPDAQTIIDMTTGHTLEDDTGYTSDTKNKLDFTVDYQSGLTKPLISVKLYRRNYDTVSTLAYSLVDMQDYVTETLENINVEKEYSAIPNSTIASSVSNPEETKTFNLSYTLKDNLVSGTYKVVFTLYDYDELTQYEEVENPDGSTTLVELPDKLPVYNYIGDTFSYIVIK